LHFLPPAFGAQDPQIVADEPFDTIMDVDTPFATNLLTLPPELREIILCNLFDTPRLVPIRCPSRCRLRQSRIDKDDPSGILYACRLLRQESVPKFFAKNTLRFRHSREILEFLGDRKLDPRVKFNITRIAVDDGDIMDLAQLQKAQSDIILNTFPLMPSLRAIEFRVWARTDNEHFYNNLNQLYEYWKSIKLARDTNSAMQPDSANAPDAAVSILRSQGIHVSLHKSKEKYSSSTLYRLTQPENVHLYVHNLLLSRCPQENRKLDCAKMAVYQRMKNAGATHIKDENVLERLSWKIEDFPSLSSGRSLGERYH
jgi:hypothetical protein